MITYQEIKWEEVCAGMQLELELELENGWHYVALRFFAIISAKVKSVVKRCICQSVQPVESM